MTPEQWAKNLFRGGAKRNEVASALARAMDLGTRQARPELVNALRAARDWMAGADPTNIAPDMQDKFAADLARLNRVLSACQ